MATDIAARGIDVEELGHVVNFDVPLVPDDYIHRVGRTARAEATGDAFTFVSPQEQGDLAQIERAIGKRLPRITVPDFDYSARTEARLEVPLAERIAAIRSRKAEERARAKAKAERQAAHPTPGPARITPKPEPKRGAPAPHGRGPRRSGRRSGGGGRFSEAKFQMTDPEIDVQVTFPGQGRRRWPWPNSVLFLKRIDEPEISRICLSGSRFYDEAPAVHNPELAENQDAQVSDLDQISAGEAGGSQIGDRIVCRAPARISRTKPSAINNSRAADVLVHQGDRPIQLDCEDCGRLRGGIHRDHFRPWKKRCSRCFAA